LPEDEMPFIKTRIGKNAIDHSEHVNGTAIYKSWSLNQARGIIGDQSPSFDNNFTMLWETGWAGELDSSVMTCSYDNQTCYKVKTVPVIFSISAATGYKTGG